MKVDEVDYSEPNSKKRANLDEVDSNWARLSKQQADRYETLQQQIAESRKQVKNLLL
jgi:hypothetical protein